MDLFLCLQFPRSDAKSHSQTQIESHLKLALRGLEATQHQVYELVTMVKDQSQQIERQSQQIERQSGQIERLMSKDKEQSEKMERLMSTVQDQPPQRERRGPIPFEWKIPDMSQLLRKLTPGKRSLISKPFYLFGCGYKYLLKIETVTFGFHALLSVYIKVVPGEFDESLSWPCKEKVRVTLVDQQSLLDENKSGVIDFEKGKNLCSRLLRDDDDEYRPILALANVTKYGGDSTKSILIRVNIV